MSPRHASDINDTGAVAFGHQASEPAIVINCAAFHNVERCKAQPQNAFDSNALAVDALARLCAERMSL